MVAKAVCASVSVRAQVSREPAGIDRHILRVRLAPEVRRRERDRSLEPGGVSRIKVIVRIGVGEAASGPDPVPAIDVEVHSTADTLPGPNIPEVNGIGNANDDKIKQAVRVCDSACDEVGECCGLCDRDRVARSMADEAARRHVGAVRPGPADNFDAQVRRLGEQAGNAVELVHLDVGQPKQIGRRAEALERAVAGDGG